MRIVQDPTEKTAPKARPKAADAKAKAPPVEELRKPFTPDEKKLAEAIGSGYQAVGGGITMIGMRLGDTGISESGVKTMEMAPALAEAWIDLSRRNPTVKVWLKKVTEVSSVGMVVGLHIGCAIPFLASRGIIPTPDTGEDESVFAATMNGTGQVA